MNIPLIPEKAASLLARRDFLKLGAAAGAGMLLSSPGRLWAQGGGGAELRIALIGVGAQGRVLIDALLNVPDVRIQAVCDIWEYAQTYAKNKLKKAGFEINTYVDFEDMLAKEKGLDAVIVATPDFWHAPHTVACLKAGLHVYCEKMMSNTVEGARSMVLAARESGKLLQIGHQRRSNPRYLHVLHNLIEKARICGRMTGANAQWNRAVSEGLGWPKAYAIPDDILKKYGYNGMEQFRNWRWYRDLAGGPISDLGAHQIDIFGWMLGCRPKSVMAGGGNEYFNREQFDNVMAIYEFPAKEGMVRAFYQVLTTTSSGGGYFETFMGDEGTIKISENPRLTKIYREANAPDWEKWIGLNYLLPEEVPAAPADQKVDIRETVALGAYDIPVVLNVPLHQPHLVNFFSAIRGEAKLTCDGEEAFDSEAAVFKVNDAVEARRTLEFSESDFVV